MHIRLRPSLQDPSKQLVFLVRIDGQEVPDPVSQKRWDDEQEMQKDNFDSNSTPQHNYFIQRLPKTIPFTRIIPSFIIEFTDLGYKFIFMILNGVAQWFFENTCNDLSHHQRKAYLPLPPGSKSYEHHFFSEELISINKNTIDNLSALWEGYYDAGWICDDEFSHQHYLVKVCLRLDKDKQIPDGPDAEYTMHMICGNAKLEDFFHVLCREKLTDQFSLTQLFWDEQDSYLANTPKPGLSYTYLTARVRKIWAEDMGWNFGKGGLVWVIPLPCEMSESTETTTTHGKVRSTKGRKRYY